MTKKKKKFDYRNLILFAASSFICLMILEVALRIMFPNGTTFLSKDYQSREFLMGTEYWKVWHHPTNSSVHGKDCFEKSYSFNELGLKGPEMEEGKPRIALVGDSFVEGYGNHNHETVNYFMDSLLQDRYEVLNMGTSGGFGTVHELAQYENFTRFLNPDIVVVFFLNYNDLYDNVNAISEGLLTNDLNFNYPKVASFEALKTSFEGKRPKEIANDNRFMTTKLLFKGGRLLLNYIQMASNAKLFDFRTAIAEMYSSEQTETIKKGYEITRKSLERLRLLTKQDSVELMVVSIADPFQLDEKWMSISGTRIGKDLSPTYPNEQVEKICKGLGIRYYDLYPGVTDYIEKNQLKFPYLSYECDRHYRAEGHLVTAQLITDYLKEKGLVK